MFPLKPAATVILVALSGYSFAADNPMITAPARIVVPRDTDPVFVGYISENGGYSNPRSCEYSETVSTSGDWFQCCPTAAGASCAFYTTCRDNTLYAAGGVSVDCYVNTALTCNTGVVLATPDAPSGPSYLACWQTSLGAGAFTFVQTTGPGGAAGSATATGSGGASSTGVSSTSGRRSSSVTSSSGAGASNTAGSGASGSTSSANVAALGAVGGDAGLSGGLLGGLVAFLAPLLM